MYCISGTCAFPVLPEHGTIEVVAPLNQTDNQPTYIDGTVFVFGCDHGYDHPDRTRW